MTEPIILTDVANNTWHDTFELSPDDGITLPGAEEWSLKKYRMRGGLSDGVDVVELNNGRLSMSVLPTRGMGLWKGSLGDVALGWDSPVGSPVNPMFVKLEERGGLGWLAGFNELLCRCGLAFNGPPGTDDATGWPMTLHGKIANRPASMVACQVDEEGPGKLRLLGIVDESMMFGGNLQLATMIETELGSNSITIVDKVTNLSAAPAEWELLYHLNLGRPLLGEGSRFVAPVQKVSPRDTRAAEGVSQWTEYAAPELGYAEQVYFMTLKSDEAGMTTVLLRDAAGECGLSLDFATAALPCFSLWKNTQAEADGYVTGLEPGINWPNFKPFERSHGRVGTLEPGESSELRLTLTVHDTAESVTAVERRISELDSIGEIATIHDVPTEPFCPET